MRTFALIGALVTLLFTGCASYQMGEPTELPYRTIYVAPPQNLSTLAKLEGPLNAALRQEILQTSSLELAQPGRQDATLDLTLTKAKREIAAVTTEDLGRGRKFELVLDFELSLKRPGNNEDYFVQSREFTIKRDIFTESGLVDAEYQAGPEISREAAEKAIQIITDLW
ncbi:LPS assembly lipoprotein LptE [Pelagicoccus mobilis]|uniref:LPS-assembly lipoprotein n=1 Tax=Pelagicoccus mobilis TaxID=415221 RepID=A0A934RXL6_9BACT|nr:LPS assembly lipoprotein LptE [Pelagicoccus mobilis]MBK1878642.1 hypothetical protein [Pelagicoccus mobilis]